MSAQIDKQAVLRALDIPGFYNREISGLKVNGSPKAMGLCPLHDDHNPSFSVDLSTGAFHCFGCHEKGSVFDFVIKRYRVDFTAALEIVAKESGISSEPKKKIVKTYDYLDENGVILFQTVRQAPKGFRQRRPDGKGGWIWNLEGVRLVPYNLPLIIEAEGVVIVEGEKDAENVRTLGFPATTSPMGAGKWKKEFNQFFKGKQVLIIPDNDEVGQKHAEAVAENLNGMAKGIKIINLPGLPAKGDVSDWIRQGGTGEKLLKLAKQNPEWTPKVATQENPQPATLNNIESITSWVRGEILAVLTDANCKGAARNQKVARITLSALMKVGRLYYHAEQRDFDTAMFFNQYEKQLLRIRADAFQSWLSMWLGVNRADGLYKFVFSEIETAALSERYSTPIIPESFWTSRSDAIYLSNGDGRAVKISAEGVQVVDNGADGVLFAAGRTLSPWILTDPQDAFESCRLFRNAHCSADHGSLLLHLWAYSLPSNSRSKPPLCLPGPVGSGKTRTTKGIAELYGIPFLAHKVEEKSEADFWPACDAGGMLVLDNADTRCRWLADTLANAATDGCSQRRKLYTNSETVTLHARAWLAVTTANPTFASDSGLADRLIVVRMDRREGEDTSDAELGEEIAAARNAGLSHLAKTLSEALADKAPVPAGLNHRHPDFAAFAVRIGRALNLERETLHALRLAERDKALFCLENDPVAAVLIGFLEQQPEGFTGTAAELCPKLIERDAELDGRLSPKRLSKRLTALWPHLQATLKVVKREEDRKGFSIFTLKKGNSADFADFETPFPIKSLCNSSREVLEKQPLKVGKVGKCADCGRDACMLSEGQREQCGGPF